MSEGKSSAITPLMYSYAPGKCHTTCDVSTVPTSSTHEEIHQAAASGEASWGATNLPAGKGVAEGLHSVRSIGSDPSMKRPSSVVPQYMAALLSASRAARTRF